MKKENLGKMIAGGAILILLILVIVIMSYKGKIDSQESTSVQNQSNSITNEVVDKETPQESTEMKGPQETMQAGTEEEIE